MNGIMVLVVALAFMFAMWAAVLYGAKFFGPQ